MYKQRKVSTYGHRPWLEDSQAIIYLNVKESPKYIRRLYTAWNYQGQSFAKNFAWGGIWTHDLWFTRPMLYRLSYPDLCNLITNYIMFQETDD